MFILYFYLFVLFVSFVFFKQKTAYEMRISDWSSDVCFSDLVTEFSRGLRSLGPQPGERVVLVAENRPEWLVADLAIIAAGGITVPAYTTALTSDHRHALGRASCRERVCQSV